MNLPAVLLLWVCCVATSSLAADNVTDPVADRAKFAAAEVDILNPDLNNNTDANNVVKFQDHLKIIKDIYNLKKDEVKFEAIKQILMDESLVVASPAIVTKTITHYSTQTTVEKKPEETDKTGKIEKEAEKAEKIKETLDISKLEFKQLLTVLEEVKQNMVNRQNEAERMKKQEEELRKEFAESLKKELEQKLEQRERERKMSESLKSQATQAEKSAYQAMSIPEDANKKMKYNQEIKSVSAGGIYTVPLLRIPATLKSQATPTEIDPTTESSISSAGPSTDADLSTTIPGSSTSPAIVPPVPPLSTELVTSITTSILPASISAYSTLAKELASNTVQATTPAVQATTTTLEVQSVSTEIKLLIVSTVTASPDISTSLDISNTPVISIPSDIVVSSDASVSTTSGAHPSSLSSSIPSAQILQPTSPAPAKNTQSSVKQILNLKNPENKIFMSPQFHYHDNKVDEVLLKNAVYAKPKNSWIETEVKDSEPKIDPLAKQDGESTLEYLKRVYPQIKNIMEPESEKPQPEKLEARKLEKPQTEHTSTKEAVSETKQMATGTIHPPALPSVNTENPKMATHPRPDTVYHVPHVSVNEAAKTVDHMGRQKHNPFQVPTRKASGPTAPARVTTTYQKVSAISDNISLSQTSSSSSSSRRSHHVPESRLFGQRHRKNVPAQPLNERTHEGHRSRHHRQHNFDVFRFERVENTAPFPKMSSLTVAAFALFVCLLSLL